MKALSLWQPWASLIALNVKTIETRSWQTKYRGPLAIHAAKRHPDLDMGEEGPEGDIFSPNDDCLVQWAQQDPRDWFPDRPPPPDKRWWCWVASDPIPRHPMPLGAVVATCELVDCCPIGGPYSFKTGIFEGDAGDFPGQAVVVYHPAISDLMAEELVLDRPNGPTKTVTDQHPYGDFTPGRWAWILQGVEPVDPPVPAVGHQGLWEWETPSA